MRTRICFLVGILVCGGTWQRTEKSENHYAVAVAAVAADRSSLGVSESLLGQVEEKLSSTGKVAVSGKRLSGFRSEISNEDIWKYGSKMRANGVVVLQFKPGTMEGRGRVYLWTASPSDTVIEKPTLVEEIDTGHLRSDQISKMAAVIEQAASAGREVAIELHVYTNPPKALYRVGRSSADITDEKGFALWVGTQPEGVLSIQASKDPDYVPATRSVQVSRGADEGLSVQTVQFNLQRRRK